MSNSVRLEIDKKTFDHVQSQLDALNKGGVNSAYRALMKVAFKIKSEAQLRLTGRGHINTSRLKNSIFVQTKIKSDVIKNNNSLTYSDKKGNSYSSELTTVSLGDNEFAIGTNVEYAASIELGAKSHIIKAKNAKVLSNGKRIFGRQVNHPGFAGDSFLYWALKNVNVAQSVAKDMQYDLKFGKFLGKFGSTAKTGKALTNND